MRKMFNTLKSLVATAVMVSMLGTASLATSCVDEYDDTEIRNDLSNVKKELAELTKRVANLETKLNSEVAALKSMIDGLNVVVSADKVGDDWKITLADGTEFTVYGPCDAEDTDTDVDTYLVPKKDTDGVYYWAVVDDTLGEELTEEWLLVDGQKVPVFGAAECDCEPSEPCTCEPAELKFDVDATTGNLLVSIDGGKTYVDSGIKAENVCNCDPNAGGSSESNCIIKDVDLWTEPGYAIFTLQDGSTVKVEIAQDGAGIIANIKGGRLNFTFGATKSAELDLKNVVDIAVMDKPEGWRAKIVDNVLNITAPTEEAVAAGADAEGYVRLHATSEEGTCKIAKVKVSTNAGLEITVDAKTGEFTVTNPMLVEYEDWWSGETYYDFAQFYVGLAPLAEFEADPIGYIENINRSYDAIYMIGNNLYTGDPYEAGVCEVMILESSAAVLYNYVAYGELPEGEHYVVWACPMDETGYSVSPTDVVYSYYKPAVNKVEQLSASFCDVEVSILLSGATSYEYVVDYASNWKEEGGWNPIEGALQEWKSYKPMYAQYGMEYYFGYGNSIKGEINFEGSLAEFKAGEYEADLLKPNTEYALVVLPVEEGKAYEAYTTEDVLIYTFTTTGIVSGGNSTITITPNASYTSLQATIEYSDDVIAAYWNFFEPTDEKILAGGDTTADYMLEKGNITTTFPTNANKNYGLSMGQTMTLVVMALNANGQYTIETLDMTTKEMEYSNETVAIDKIEGLNNQIAVTLSVSGGNVTKYRVYPLASYNLDYYTEDTIKNTLMTNSDEYYTYSTVLVADGTVKGKSASWDAETNTLTVNGVYNGTAYTVFVVAQFEDGTWSANMASAEATPSLVLEPFYVSTSAEAQEVYTTLGDPMIYDMAVDGTWLDFSVKFDKLAEGQKVYVYLSEEEVMTSQAGSRDNKRAAYVVDNGTMLAGPTEYVALFTNHNGKDIYYAVQNADGSWYGTFVFDLGQVYDAVVNGGGGAAPASK